MVKFVVKRSDGEDGGQAPLPEEEVEFVVAEQQEAAPDTQKILEELKKKEEEFQRLQQQADSTAALRESFGSFAETMKKQMPGQVPQAPVAPQQQFDIEKARKEFEENIFKDPWNTMMSAFNQYGQMQSSQMATQNLAYSRRLVSLDSETKDYYNRWGEEIEREVANMPMQVKASNPDVYRQAVDLVKARHLNELIQEQTAAMVKAELEKAGVVPGGQTAQPQRPIQYAESGRVAPSAAASASQKRTIAVPAALMNQIRDEARRKGIPEDALLEVYRSQGIIR